MSFRWFEFCLILLLGVVFLGLSLNEYFVGFFVNDNMSGCRVVCMWL